ncbi:MAG: hypothetical protein WC205_10335 [Opitutaceae bacterium]|jgi:hypothetical protein
MKIKLTLASLLLATVSPALFAITIPVDPEPIPGKVGDVTIALVDAYTVPSYNIEGEQPGFKTFTDSSALLKTQIKFGVTKTKISNTEFIQSLIDNNILDGASSDWSIKYVSDTGFIFSEDYSGYYALKNTGEVIYLGSQFTDGPVISSDNFTSDTGTAFSLLQTATTKRIADVDQTTTNKGSLKGSITTYLTVDTGNENPITLVGLYNLSITFSEVYDEIGDTTISEDYGVGASSVTNLVGNDGGYANIASSFFFGGQGIVTGSIKISALKTTADITDYVNAYDAYYMVR